MAIATGAEAQSPAPAPATPAGPAAAEAPDPFQWLEEVDSPRAMAWVKAQNSRTLGVLEADARYPDLRDEAMAIAEAKDRVPSPVLRGGMVYNFWQDEAHVHGLWRRTTLASYRTADPQWETLIDLDALSRAEGVNWVYKGAQCRWPAYDRCLVLLSDGGKDAVRVREFDLPSKSFVKDGFNLPEGKQDVAWVDPDTVLVSRDFGPGTMTASGYAYIVKRWRRGESLDQAAEVFRGQPTDVGVTPIVLHDGDGDEVRLFVRNITFYEGETWIDTPTGPQKLALPGEVQMRGLVSGQLLYTLQQDWRPPGFLVRSGSLISIDAKAAAAAPGTLRVRLVLQPEARQSIEAVSTTRNQVLISFYEDVKGTLRRYRFDGLRWAGNQIVMPKNASVGIVATETDSDRYFASADSFLTPNTLWFGDARDGYPPEKVKALPPRFDASADVVEQFEATSADGTKIPYFVVRPKALKYDGQAPTLLYAYGGFQLSMTPAYSATVGKLWLEKGGVYVMANIRGGGEFGPAWHQAGLKRNRQRVFDDFAAVAQDLIARQITSPRRLGMMGGSNGGLLMGVEMTQHPELWTAVVAQSPLFDMLRYTRLLAGASWIAEYGDPDNPAERPYLAAYSPYQNLKAGVAYPEPLFVTSTADDRVSPGHARKMAALMQSLGLPVLYYENTDGGHSGAANLQEAAERAGLEFVYLSRKLMD